ncbi:DNA topoisomerase [Elusimicrobium minutum Pei191]|uniref:DNA topoisomerase 1 n=1 Tax=Elusimicrobium minutum (strain Pei191) TaxID=445932 RepID=B2KBN6_ELUMP|nr:type I DNA topoisomerase [Elusimicrobium minutum]ACC97723.1 DNA topoisomerase [Elusimicrobium minutum Pei191]
MATKKTTTKKTESLSKGKNLVIVESPTKQKTISKILGADYVVKSSFGHVRDLPSKEIGVDEKNGFKPKYVPVEKAKKMVSELEKLAKGSEYVYLATDPDREGEAIAWHLVELLKIPVEKIRRIFFHEITPAAVKASFDHARNINKDLVDAQQARRVLDRLVGYKLSPLLWKKITGGLSAGRVQSVAVRLLAERAKEIENFREEEYYSLTSELEKQGETPKFNARMLKWRGKNTEIITTYHLFAEDYKVKTTVFKKPEDLAPVNSLLRQGPLTVSKIEKKEVKQKAKPPFITSSLQQEAYNKIGFPSQKTMMTAQSLYEGVEIAGEVVGLITYMRTDSFNVSKDLQSQTKKFIAGKYGDDFVPPTPNFFKSKVKGAQEAHESIHPTDVYKTPASIKDYLSADQYKLYELIWLRFIASQMADAVFNTVSVDITAGKAEECVLRATGRTVKFPGFLSVYKEDDSEEEDEGSALLPNLTEGDDLNLIDIVTKSHKTAPPPNYNEASLIKTLEKHGIGRPSTYAPTIKTILDRKYIIRQPKTNKLIVTDLGVTVTDQLKDFFKDIMDLSYTAGIEEKLDDIAEGDNDWVKVIGDFYEGFKKDLATADKDMQRAAPKPSDEKCPLCGSPMVIRRSRFGEYLACSTYPECKGKINLTSSGEKLAPEVTEEKCEKCGSPMVIRSGRRGKFMACSAFPKCKNTFSIDASGNKVASSGPIETKIKCEKCGKPMLLRASKRGEFLGCSGYPKCKTIVSVSPEEIAKIKKEHEAENK